MKTLYFKEVGFDEFYKASYRLRVSHKGNRIAHPEAVEKISRYAYYKAPASARASYRCFTPDHELHEIGESHLLDILEATEG